MSAPVFDELTCPTCGGQIGGSGADGLKPCTCFAEKPAPKRRRAALLTDDPDPVDMVPLKPIDAHGGDPMTPDAPPPAVPGAKLCRVCGKDLKGRTRMKDERGYICKSCSDAEFAAEADAERDAMECPECLRKLKPEAFVEYRGSLICKRCRAHHNETDKLKVGKVELVKHAEAEKQSVLRWAIVAGVLMLLAIIATLVHR